MDLQLPVQSVCISPLKRVRIMLMAGVLDTTLCDKVCQ
jgi:hypothetical protein